MLQSLDASLVKQFKTQVNTQNSGTGKPIVINMRLALTGFQVLTI